MNELTTSIVTVAVAIIGLATLAVLVSKQANTAGVIQAGAGGLAQDIGAAVSPITGGGGMFGGLGNFSGGAGLPQMSF
jgi:hypothetical protein